MGAVIEWFNDITSRRLVKSATDAADFFTQDNPGEYFHNDLLSLRIKFLQKNPSGSRTANPYTVVAVGSLIFEIKLYDSTGATVLASQTTWTPNTGDNANTLSGTLNLNTAAMTTAFSDPATKTVTAILELKLDNQVVFQKRDITIRRQYNTSGSPVAIENEAFLTEKQCNDRFVRFVSNAAGNYIELTSPDGSKKVLLGVNDDGTFYASVI